MPVWGREGGWPCPFRKYVKKYKKKKEKKEKKERRKRIEEKDEERELHRHDVWSKLPLCFTNGGRDLRTVRTHTFLLGGLGPGRGLEVSVPAKTGKSKRANKTTPTRHLPVFPNAFDIDFTWGLPLSFPMFLEAQVRRATVTSSRRRAGVFNLGCAASLEKNYQRLAIASRRGAMTRFVTDLEVEELARQFETLSWHDGRQHVALPARTSDQRRCADVNTGCRPTLALQQLARISSLNDSISFFSFFSWTLPKTFI